jgi:predicted enzyme related to lactoylglutathione lyase
MAEVTSYAHGTPSWIDLASPDPAASKEFYGALFGWSFDDLPAGDGAYTMCSKGDKSAAGMMQLTEQMASVGMPPVWSTYVTVDDIEAAVGKVGACWWQRDAPADGCDGLRPHVGYRRPGWSCDLSVGSEGGNRR